jgi:hypothetical protein
VNIKHEGNYHQRSKPSVHRQPKFVNTIRENVQIVPEKQFPKKPNGAKEPVAALYHGLDLKKNSCISGEVQQQVLRSANHCKLQCGNRPIKIVSK